jgi:hypothetical protein
MHSLGNNNITSAGATAIADALHHVPSLTYLRYYGGSTAVVLDALAHHDAPFPLVLLDATLTTASTTTLLDH